MAKRSKPETAMPAMDREWRARADLDALKQAHEIMADRGRMKAAQGMAKEQMKVMQKVAGPMAMPKSHGGGLGFAKK